MDYIKREDLVVGKLYKVKARNFEVAEWVGDGFVGMRTKFGNTYPFKEYHWDDGPPYGTVKPIKVVELPV